MTTQLNTLIRLRKYEVDRSRSQLAVISQQEQAWDRRLAELDGQIELHRGQLADLSHTGRLNIDAIRLRQQHLRQLAAQRVELLARQATARGETQEYRNRLIAADQRLQVAETLRDRALRESQSQIERQETRESEEAWQATAHAPEADSQ